MRSTSAQLAFAHGIRDYQTWKGSGRENPVTGMPLGKGGLVLTTNESRRCGFASITPPKTKRDTLSCPSVGCDGTFITARALPDSSWGSRPEVTESDYHTIEPYQVKKWIDQWQLLGL
jgi:hypothetical protein